MNLFFLKFILFYYEIVVFFNLEMVCFSSNEVLIIVGYIVGIDFLIIRFDLKEKYVNKKICFR